MALTGPEFLKKWTGAAVGAVMGATAILTPFSAAQAGDPAQIASVESSASKQLRDEQIQERQTAELAAMAYSNSKPVIGIVVLGTAINNDTGERSSPDQIGEWIESNFAKFGIESKTFAARDDLEGFAVLFTVRGETYGYYGGDKLNDGFKLAKAHLPQAWEDELAGSAVNAVSRDPS